MLANQTDSNKMLTILLVNWKKSKVISIDEHGCVTLSGTGDEVKLKDLLRALFVHNAWVSHINSFLSKILKHINEIKIKNKKLIKLICQKKHDYESHGDEDCADNFQDTMQDIAMPLRGRGMRVTNKIIWGIT